MARSDNSGQAAQTNSNNQVPPNIDIGSSYTPRRPAPLISISVNHPFATAARKIKNFLIHKQTLFSTTFSIKITPIVAIVSLAGVAALFGGGITTAYNFGKTVEQKFLASATPTPGKMQSPTSPSPVQIITNISKSGTIKATYQLPTVSPTTIITPSSNSTQSATAIPTPTATPLPILHYILVAKNGSITYLQSSNVNLQLYLGLRALVTGSYDTAKNTLTINKSSDIEILN